MQDVHLPSIGKEFICANFIDFTFCGQFSPVKFEKMLRFSLIRENAKVKWITGYIKQLPVTIAGFYLQYCDPVGAYQRAHLTFQLVLVSKPIYYSSRIYQF